MKKLFLSLLAFTFILVLFTGEASAAQKAIGTACSSDNSNVDWDTIGQCNGTVFQSAPLILGAVTVPPYAATTCDSGKAGMLQWTGTSFQGCDGSAWKAMVGNTPNAFSFTDQTGVTVSTTISSNAVTLSGFTGVLSAYCSGCSAIARNGTWGGTTLAGFVSGDTIALRQISSATGNTSTTASVTVGGTTSGLWTVTTTAASPDAFGFTDQTDVNAGQTITSNTVTLTGTFSGMTATCNGNCSGIANNGVWGGQAYRASIPMIQ